MTTLVPRPGILDIVPYVPGNADTLSPNEAVFLASNESPLGPSPDAVAAYRSLERQLHRYPDGASQQLRQALGQQYGLNPEAIVCGNGSERLIDLLCRAYAGPGDEILYSQHGFLMYRISALAVGATPVTAPEQNYTADVDALLAAVTPRTRIVFLANPNNPTGTYINANELQRLRASLPAQVLLVIDAAYAEYVTVEDYRTGYELVSTANENVVVLQTFSKIYGLAALRLGWAYCPLSIAAVLNRIRGSFNISAPAQAAGVAACLDQAHVNAARSHNNQYLPWLQQAVNELGVQVIPSVANFILARFASAGQANAVQQYLSDRAIIVRPMSAYGLADCLRITVGLAEENRRFVAALAEAI